MDGPVEPPAGSPYDRGMEQRLSRVENDVREVKDSLVELKAMFARMDERLEQLATKADVAKVESRLDVMDARLDATLPHVATKADVAKVENRLDVMDARLDATLPHLATSAGLAEKPGKTYMWGILGVLLTAYACGLAALAVLK